MAVLACGPRPSLSDPTPHPPSWRWPVGAQLASPSFVTISERPPDRLRSRCVVPWGGRCRAPVSGPWRRHAHPASLSGVDFGRRCVTVVVATTTSTVVITVTRAPTKSPAPAVGCVLCADPGSAPETMLPPGFCSGTWGEWGDLTDLYRSAERTGCLASWQNEPGPGVGGCAEQEHRPPGRSPGGLSVSSLCSGRLLALSGPQRGQPVGPGVPPPPDHSG